MLWSDKFSRCASAVRERQSFPSQILAELASCGSLPSAGTSAVSSPLGRGDLPWAPVLPSGRQQAQGCEEEHRDLFPGALRARARSDCGTSLRLARGGRCHPGGSLGHFPAALGEAGQDPGSGRNRCTPERGTQRHRHGPPFRGPGARRCGLLRLGAPGRVHVSTHPQCRHRCPDAQEPHPVRQPGGGAQGRPAGAGARDQEGYALFLPSRSGPGQTAGDLRAVLRHRRGHCPHAEPLCPADRRYRDSPLRKIPAPGTRAGADLRSAPGPLPDGRSGGGYRTDESDHRAGMRTMPEQYFWVHRRFKTRPAGEPPFYEDRRR